MPPSRGAWESQFHVSGHSKQPPESSDTGSDVPASVGAFRILSVLGEGGMGVVYLAEQPSPRRKVALKVIRPGYASGPMIRRFEMEAQVLGLLQHPGVAQVYDAGVAQTELGRQPYFAMEYVEGSALLDFMRERRLDIRDRLRLLARICAAVHHAHTKGVIHRDLKPGNILVSKEGNPKVLDFGVARAIDSDVHSATMHTDAGQLVGTLAYMSPEQVAGEASLLDTRSDVYALGVIVYEALAGRPPYDVHSRSLAVAVRTIAESEPAPLSSHDRRLRGDVETIVRKALEKDPDHRYQAAADLGADIDRFLRNEPITARPPSSIYIVSKFARRNRAVFAGLMIAALALAAGVAGVSWQAVRATQQRNRAVYAEGQAEIRRTEAEQARRSAEAQQREAEEKAAIATATSDFLTTMLTSADPEVTMDRNVPVRAVLAQAAANADTAFKGQPAVEASVRSTLGALYKNLGDAEAAEVQYRRAIALLTTIEGADGWHTLEASCSLTAVIADAGRIDEAMDLSQRTLDTVRARFGRSDPLTVAAMSSQARVYAERGATADAAAMLQDAVAIGRQVLGERDEQVLTIMHNLATTLGQLGRLAEAETLMRETLQLRSEVYGPEHLQTLYTTNGLATLLGQQGRFAEAEPLMRQTLEIRERVLGPDHAVTLVSVQNLANCLIQLKRLEEAEPLARRAYSDIPKALGEDHPRVQVATNSMGFLMEDMGQLDEAETYYRRAVELVEQQKGRSHPESFGPINNLAMLQMKQGKLADAELRFRDLIASAIAAAGPDHFYVGIFRNNLGECLVNMQRYDEAEKELLESEAILEAALGVTHPRTQKAIDRLASLYHARGDATAAEQWKSRRSANP